MSWRNGRQEARLRAIEYANDSRGITRCMCGWRYQGRFGIGRDLFRKHRETECKLVRQAAA